MANTTADLGWIDCHALRADEEARGDGPANGHGLRPDHLILENLSRYSCGDETEWCSRLKLIEPDGTVIDLSDSMDEAALARAAAREEAARIAAEDKAREVERLKAEAAARVEAERKAQQEAERKAREEAEARAKAEAEEKARLEAEAKAKKEAEEKARREAEAKAKAKKEAEEKARREAEAKAKRAAEEAKRKAEARRIAKEKAEAQARAREEEEARAAEEARQKAAAEAKAKAAAKAKKEAEEKAKRAAEAKAKKEAEERAKREAEAKARKEAEEKAKREAEAKAKKEAEEKARREAEAKAKKEAEEKAKREAEAKAKKKAEEKARREAEAKAKKEAEERAKREAEERAIKEAEEKARREAEEQARLAAELTAKRDAAEQAKRDAEERARREAEAAAKIDLAATYRRLIPTSGPISLSQYMGESNAKYYANRDPLGEEGDFITAPEISQMFGELIGLWIADIWVRMGQSKNIHYVELGPGRGTLTSDVMRTASRYDFDPTIHFVESSPTLRKLQKQKFPRAVHHYDLTSLPEDRPLMIVANEFFDALPIKQLLRAADGWYERMIGLEGDELTFVAGEERVDDLVPPSWRKASQGTMIETSPASNAMMAEISRRLVNQGGVALIIDYGPLEARAGSTLQALKAHKKVDPLAYPGEADITAHVDFEHLSQIAREQGAEVMGLQMQGEWLHQMGIESRFEALKRKQPGDADVITRQFDRLMQDDQMGTLFKVLGVCGRRWPIGVGFE